jgi:cytochrome c biogenesis protein CcmG/thiol:disulfide interchange protein DsbE
MDQTVRNKKKKINHLLPLIFIGAGLIVLGLVSAKVISADGFKNDYSVVPSQVNFPAPELTLNNLQGEKVSISDYKQNIVLINNWATWCPPCRAEMPTLARYYKEHSDQGFTLIGIEAGDPKDDVVSFVNDYKLTFPILLDPNNKSLIAFHNDSLPSSYVIDRDGNVILAWTGPINQAMLEKYVTPLLEQ